MDTEARLFKIAVFVITLVIAGVMLANIIYYNGMVNNNYPSKSDATAMLWISAIVFTIAAILWIWSIYRMFHKETREEYKKEATRKFTDWAYDTNSGITKEDIRSIQSKVGYGQTVTTQAPATQAPAAPAVTQGPSARQYVSHPTPAPAPVLHATAGPMPTEQKFITTTTNTGVITPISSSSVTHITPPGTLSQGGPPSVAITANS